MLSSPVFSFFFIILLSLFGFTNCVPKTPPAEAELRIPNYSIARSTQAITIDGNLDDAAWTKAPKSSNFISIDGNTQASDSLPIYFRMLHDANAWYIAAHITCPHIFAMSTARDAPLYREMAFEIFYQIPGDSAYVELQINPLNTIWDLQMDQAYRSGGQAQSEYSITGLMHAVHIDGSLNDASDEDDAWKLELQIPKSNLPMEQARLYFNASFVQARTNAQLQVIPHSSRYLCWASMGTINLHQPEKWGQLIFE